MTFSVDDAVSVIDTDQSAGVKVLDNGLSSVAKDLPVSVSSQATQHFSIL
jgi:hypothetical protein